MNEREVEQVQRELRRGRADPDAFFAQRGIVLSCYEADGWWWAAMKLASRYGRGKSETEAKIRAVERWIVEQEGPDLRRRPGDSLP